MKGSKSEYSKKSKQYQNIAMNGQNVQVKGQLQNRSQVDLISQKLDRNGTETEWIRDSSHLRILPEHSTAN